MKSAPPLVVSLTRDKLSLCNAAFPAPLVLAIPGTSVKDLEVVNASELTTLIKNFVSSHQIHASPLLMVLSHDVCFEKNLSEIPVTERAAAAQNFIDSVPLISVSSKVFHIKNSEVLVVINRNLYEIIKDAFESLNFIVDAVVPGRILGEVGIKEEVSAAACQMIPKKSAFLKDNSFLSDLDMGRELHQKQHAFLQKYQVIIIILVLLSVGSAIAAGIYTFKSFRRPVPNRQPIPTSRPRPTLPLPSPAEASSEGGASLTGLTIQISNGSTVTGAATLLQQKLSTLGSPVITTSNAPTSPKTFIVFSPKVTSNARQLVLDIVKLSFPQLTSQENSTSQYDVLITLGQLTP